MGKGRSSDRRRTKAQRGRLSRRGTLLRSLLGRWLPTSWIHHLGVALTTGLVVAWFLGQRPFEVLAAAYLTSAGQLVLAIVALLTGLGLRRRAIRRGQQAEVPTGRLVEALSRSFLCWFVAHGLFWSGVAFLGAAVALHALGPQSSVQVLWAGLVAGATVSLSGMLSPGPWKLLALCWEHPGPWARQGVSGRARLAALGAAVALGPRFEAALRADLTLARRDHTLPLFTRLQTALDRARFGRPSPRLDLALQLGPALRVEAGLRCRTFAGVAGISALLALPLVALGIMVPAVGLAAGEWSLARTEGAGLDSSSTVAASDNASSQGETAADSLREPNRLDAASNPDVGPHPGGSMASRRRTPEAEANWAGSSKNGQGDLPGLGLGGDGTPATTPRGGSRGSRGARSATPVPPSHDGGAHSRKAGSEERASKPGTLSPANGDAGQETGAPHGEGPNPASGPEATRTSSPARPADSGRGRVSGQPQGASSGARSDASSSAGGSRTGSGRGRDGPSMGGRGRGSGSSAGNSQGQSSPGPRAFDPARGRPGASSLERAAGPSPPIPGAKGGDGASRGAPEPTPAGGSGGVGWGSASVGPGPGALQPSWPPAGGDILTLDLPGLAEGEEVVAEESASDPAPAPAAAPRLPASSADPAREPVPGEATQPLPAWIVRLLQGRAPRP